MSGVGSGDRTTGPPQTSPRPLGPAGRGESNPVAGARSELTVSQLPTFDPAGSGGALGSPRTWDWSALAEQWWRDGFARIPSVLGADDCHTLAGLYAERGRFRSRVIMAQHNYGRGEYAYFAHPLPKVVAALRRRLYPHLVPWANEMMERLGRPQRYPDSLAEFHDRCHAAGQCRPTPLLLRYESGDFNCLHRDLYGDVAFPLQAAVFLSKPEHDYTGGEFVLVENRPRQQSRARVVPAKQGDMVIFATNERPVAGAKKTLRATVRHGVSEVTSGERWVLGIIFHDAS